LGAKHDQPALLKVIEVLPDRHRGYIERARKLPGILRSVALEPLQDGSPRSHFGSVVLSSRHIYFIKKYIDKVKRAA
jgi:hypothetical protein